MFVMATFLSPNRLLILEKVAGRGSSSDPVLTQPKMDTCMVTKRWLSRDFSDWFLSTFSLYATGCFSDPDL
jgi:hypothetical protein